MAFHTRDALRIFWHRKPYLSNYLTLPWIKIIDYMFIPWYMFSNMKLVQTNHELLINQEHFFYQVHKESRAIYSANSLP